jgi:hypothetical protein
MIQGKKHHHYYKTNEKDRYKRLYRIKKKAIFLKYPGIELISCLQKETIVTSLNPKRKFPAKERSDNRVDCYCTDTGHKNRICETGRA